MQIICFLFLEQLRDESVLPDGKWNIARNQPTKTPQITLNGKFVHKIAIMYYKLPILKTFTMNNKNINIVIA